MRTSKFLFWMILPVMVMIVASCGDKEDVHGTGEYKYYLEIQSQVRLHLSENAEDENGMVNPLFDRLSRTIYYMKQAVVDNDSLQVETKIKEAALFTTLDSLYQNYAVINPENRGNVICFVKLIRTRMNSDGTIGDAVTLKYYSFWRDGYGGGNGGNEDSSSNDYLAPPESLEAVDLGLSVLWANCNLGAKQPRNYGAHLAWGEPTGVLWSGRGIGWDDNGYTWDTNNYGGNNPPADIAQTDLDIVTQNWGEGWHIPSYSEALELCEQCQWELQTYGDIKWYKVIGPNGNSIIMPLAGIYGDDLYATYRFQRGPLGVNEMGSYWTSTSCPTPSTAEERGYGVNDDVVTAWSFRFNSNNGDDMTPVFVDYVRAYHMSIRAVHDKY